MQGVRNLKLMSCRFTISIRDLLSWVMFVNATVSCTEDIEMTIDDGDNNTSSKTITLEEAYVHGACLVFIDAIGSGNTAFAGNKLADAVKKDCIKFLSQQVGFKDFSISNNMYTDNNLMFGLHPFFINKGNFCCCYYRNVLYKKILLH